jgi:hypothetical protein
VDHSLAEEEEEEDEEAIVQVHHDSDSKHTANMKDAYDSIHRPEEQPIETFSKMKP